MGERGDIVRTMQRAMNGKPRELGRVPARRGTHAIIGRWVGKGMADELHDKGYLVVDGIDGKAHYVALPPRVELEQYPVGAVVEGERFSRRSRGRQEHHRARGRWPVPHRPSLGDGHGPGHAYARPQGGG
jgi:type IV secretory pathway VirD2 relaxase